jgi:hypothetical protein
MDSISIPDDMREEFYRLFPKLRGSPHCFTSAEDSGYNCVAWAMGDKGRNWDPLNGSRYYWPLDSGDNSLDAYIRAFRTQGFESCLDAALEEGVEKIAIYTVNEQHTARCLFKHVARQLPSGKWTSKCGETFDLSHRLEALEGDKYGKATHFMKREPGASQVG